jgi:hypothetical protein
MKNPHFWMEEEDYIIYYEGVSGLSFFDLKTSKITWMNYKSTGIVCSDGKIISFGEVSSYLESFLVRADHGDDVDWFIQPFKQDDGSYWAQVVLSNIPSNLPLCKIHIFGCDDASYSKHYLSLDDAYKDIEFFKDNGISKIDSMDFFFTN